MQDIICHYLKQMKNKDQECFRIGEEIFNPKDTVSRYFKIKFSELRTDESYLQYNPHHYHRVGYLKIDEKGDLNLLDIKFEAYQASRVFYFDSKAMILKSKRIPQLENHKTIVTKCLQGALALTFWGTAAYLGKVALESPHP